MTSGEQTGLEGIVPVLKKSLRFAESLRTAAHDCARNFEWAVLHGRRHMVLLDFDIVRGAIPRLGLQRSLEQSGRRDDTTIFSMNFGPGLVSYLLRVMREFVIPPGTAAEMLSYRSRIETNVSSRANRFLRRVNEALELQDPAKVLDGEDHAKLRSLLAHDLTRFEEDFQEHELVCSLLSRATATEDLIDSTSEHKPDADTFRRTLSFLQATRPDFSINNVHDALNASLVVHLFNARRGMPGSLVPVLASGTRAVRELDDLSRSSLRLDIDGPTPLLFVSQVYLVVSQSLLAYTEGRYRPAVDFAKSLAKQAALIGDGSRRVLHRIREKHGSLPSTLAEWDWLEDDRTWRYLLFQRELFSRRWGSLMGGPTLAGQQDRANYLKLLLSREFRESLGATPPERRLDVFAEQLRGAAPFDHELWKFILRMPQERSPVEAARRAFSVYFAENDGTLLRQVASTVPFDSSRLEETRRDHDLLAVAIPAFVTSGAVFAVGSMRVASVSEVRYISVTWLHLAGAAELGRVCADVLGSLITDKDQLSVDAYTPAQQQTRSATLSQVGEVFESEIVTNSQIDFVHVATDGCRVYFDVTPLEASEMQFGIVLEETRLSHAVVSKIAQAMSASLEVPMTDSYARGLLESILIGFGAWPRAEGEGAS